MSKKSTTYYTWRKLKENTVHAIHPAWSDYKIFIKDMGEKPHGYKLQRIDKSKGYFPDNCHWVEM